MTKKTVTKTTSTEVGIPEESDLRDITMRSGRDGTMAELRVHYEVDVDGQKQQRTLDVSWNDLDEKTQKLWKDLREASCTLVCKNDPDLAE